MKVYSGQWRKPLKTKVPNICTKRKPSYKKKYLCVNGPLKGHHLWLTDGESAFFTINGQTGQYKMGDWHASAR